MPLPAFTYDEVNKVYRCDIETSIMQAASVSLGYVHPSNYPRYYQTTRTQIVVEVRARGHFHVQIIYSDKDDRLLFHDATNFVFHGDKIWEGSETSFMRKWKIYYPNILLNIDKDLLDATYI